MRILSFIVIAFLMMMGISCASHKSGMTFQSGQSKKNLIKEKISLASALYDAGEIDAAIAALNELIETQRYTDELSEAFENLVHFYLLNGERKKAKLVAGQFMRLHWQSPRAKKIQALFDQYKSTNEGMYTPVEKSEEVIDQPNKEPLEEAPLPAHEPPVLDAPPPHEPPLFEPGPTPDPLAPPTKNPPSPAQQQAAPTIEPKPDTAPTPVLNPTPTPAIKEETVPLEQKNTEAPILDEKLKPKTTEELPPSHDLFLDKEGHLKGNNTGDGTVK